MNEEFGIMNNAPLKILVVAADKGNHFTPFVEEQIEALQQKGVVVERFGVRRKGAVGYMREIPRLCRTIRRVQPDLIHAHYGLSGLLAGLSASIYKCTNLQIRNVPYVVTTYHGSDINEPKVLRLSGLAMRLSVWNIFVSQRNVEIATKAYSIANYSLIPCGVNLTDDQLLSREDARKQCTMPDAQCVSGQPMVLFAGAFDNAVKDAPLAQQSIVILNTEILLSDGKQGGRVSLVELCGYSRSEVNRLMCAADCLLLTSLREGSPQVVKEAMACGCPIVSVDVGDVRERIQDIDGCFVANTRSPQELAGLLSKALQYKGKTAGRQYVVSHGLDNVHIADRLIEIYQRILNRRN